MFAFGTLIFTVNAITVAPQVVMFLGLTHATVGLDRVRPGGPEDPDIRVPGRARFRWLTRSMLLGFTLGALGLAVTVSAIVGLTPRVAQSTPSSWSRSSSMPRWWASSWTTVTQTSSARSSGSGKSVLEGQPEEDDRLGIGDPVGAPLGPRHPLVQAVQGVVGRRCSFRAQLVRRRLVVDDDGDLVEGRGERHRDGRERLVDEDVERPVAATRGAGRSGRSGNRVDASAWRSVS